MIERLTAILPCNDLNAAQRFFERLGFQVEGGPDDYLMMSDGRGSDIHLQPAVNGWLTPGRNPFGLYLYRENVDELATAFSAEVIESDGPNDKPWGMYEFAVNGPDETLVRVGWPTRLSVSNQGLWCDRRRRTPLLRIGDRSLRGHRKIRDRVDEDG